MRRLGMQKRDIETFGPFSWRFVDQLHTAFRQFVQIGLQAFDSDREMLNTFTLLFNEFANRPIRIGRFKQFNLGLSNLEKCGSDLLLFDFFNGIALETKLLFPKRNRLIQALQQYRCAQYEIGS